MSDTDKDLAVHVAVCDERYRNIEASFANAGNGGSGIVIIKWS